MSEIQFEEYRRLVEEQGQVLLDAIQSIARGNLSANVAIPDGVEVLSELAQGLNAMLDRLREMVQVQERGRVQLERERRELETALLEVLAAQKRYMRQAWKDYSAAADGAPEFFRFGDKGGSAGAIWQPAMTAAVEQARTIADTASPDAIALALPIKLHDEVIGVLGFEREGTAGWNEDEVAAAETIVEQLAWALEGQRLYDEEQASRQHLDQRVQELDCLSDIGREIDKTPPIREFLNWVVGRVPSAMRHPALCRVAIEFEGQVYGDASVFALSRQMVQVLQVEGAMVGHIAVAYTEDRDFFDEERVLLGDITRRISGYIENRRLFAQERRRAEEQAILQRITEAISRSLEMDELVATTLETVRAALHFDAALVSLSDEQTGHLNLIGQQGLPEPLAQRLSREGLSGTLCEHVFRTGEAVAIADVRKGAPVDVQGMIRMGLLTYAGSPLIYLGKTIGTICCFNRSVQELGPRELALLESVGRQVGVGVSNARLFQDVQAALNDAEAAHRSYLRQEWQAHLRQKAMLEKSGYLFVQSQNRQPEELAPASDLWLPEMGRALAEGKAAVVTRDVEAGSGTGLALPIRVRGEMIGILGVETPSPDHHWADDDLALMEAVGEQLGQALENARLYADTQRRAERERMIGEITAKIRASTDIEHILESATTELGQALGASRTFVQLASGELAIPAAGGDPNPDDRTREARPETDLDDQGEI